MSVFTIPLSNVPQSFNISLAGKDYLMTCKWNNAPDAGWVLDFADANTNVSIVANLPLVTGVNILEGLDYLGFNGSLVVYTEGDEFAVPTLDNLGTQSNLYFITDVANG